jgi:sn-glycerol 3-phosphate transport system ATP-binding protein
MDKGLIMQRSSPKEIYHNPQNVFTAQFIGTPPMNIMETMIPDLLIGFRPEKVKLIGGDNRFLHIKGEIITKEHLGSEINYSINTAYGKIMVKTDEDVEENRSVCTLNIKKKHIYVFRKDGRCTELTEKIEEKLAALSENG